MFLRLVISRLKIVLKSPKYMFWTLFFPIGLGTLFYFAFSSIYSSTQSTPIPVVIFVDEGAIEEYKTLQAFSMLDKDSMEKDIEDYYTEKAAAQAKGEDFDKELPFPEDSLETLDSIESFDDVVKTPLSTFPAEYMTGEPEEITRDDLPFIQLTKDLEYDDGTKMIEEISCDSTDKAEKILADGDIAGIITVNKLNDVKLLVNGGGVKHSILSNIISKYLYRVNLTIDKMNAYQRDDFYDNTDIDEMMEETNFDLDYVNAQSSAGDNKDPFVAYFYNLLAMICVMGSITALNTIVNSQANQSNLGIRIDSSPVNKAFLEIADLVALFIIQAAVIVITLTYLMFGLRIRFGGDTFQIYMTAVAASTVGISLGFFIAHIGSFKLEIKESILMVVILGGGFLSGLMYQDMKSIIEENCPIINRINPSAVITDAFLSLNLFGVGKMYYRSMLYILILDVVMLLVGVILSRKRSYRSL